jgi:formyl-CoA transferase
MPNEAKAGRRAGVLPGGVLPKGGPADGVLSGLRVLELGQVLAGPFAGAILADLGADVIKVERPPDSSGLGGDDARRMGQAFRHGDSLTFQVMNRGKRSAALDLKSEAGRAALEALVRDADVFLHNLRPDVAASIGFDGESLTARHPRLIYGEISAFGAVGPMASSPGYEPLIQAWSGLSSLNGGPDDPPIRSAASLCDQGSAMWLVIGMLSLLRRREATGRGGIVRTSLLETALMWAGQKADALMGEGALPERHRSGHPALVPYEAFETADGPLLIGAGNDRLFVRLAGVLGREDLVADPRFATNRARLTHKPALFAEIVPILAGRARAHWAEALGRAGVPVSPIHTLEEALAQPQVAALGMHQPVPGEDFRLTALPMTIDGERPRIAGRAPSLDATQTQDWMDPHGRP